MRLLLLITLLIQWNKQSFSQFGMLSNWVFGDSTGVHFNLDSSISLSSTLIRTFETCATISDKEGNLLFYTNGQQVWDRENNMMLNGDSLKNGLNYSNLSTITQGVIILPDPGDHTLFYIFHLASEGFMVSQVNMELSDGMGDVTYKNNLLIDHDLDSIGLTEKMQACKHANGRDWWLVLIGSKLDDPELEFNFIKFLITPDGVSELAFQPTGVYYNNADGITTNGQSKFTQDGSKYAFTRGRHFDVSDFDRCTGEFFNLVSILEVDSIGVYGLEFSEKGNAIYLGGFDFLGSDPKLYQYCLDCEINIELTKQIIYDPNNGLLFGQMQIAPNNKIYITSQKSNEPYEDNIINTNLSVINNPNNSGLACNFDTLSINLIGKKIWWALPNMPNYNLGALAGSECDTLVSIDADLHQHDKFVVYPNPATEKINLSSNTNTVLFYSIKNNLGDEMITGSFQKQKTIEIKFLPNGIYFIEIKNEKGEIVFTEKMVKQ